MQKRPALLVAALLGVGAAASLFAAGQANDNNPGHNDPSVFLGGPKTKKTKAPTTRYLHGTVTDETNQPVPGALVTLHNAKTNDKLTFITKKDGRYHFDDLTFNVDFSVQARFKKEISTERKISQYDSRPDVVRMLELQDPQEANASK
jgi:hypothetical protein